jgi:hypothetical protein
MRVPNESGFAWPVAGLAGLFVLIFASAANAAFFSSDLNGSVQTGSDSGIYVDHMNQPVLSLSGLTDQNFGDASAGGNLAAFGQGQADLSAHGCAGGGGNGAVQNAHASANFTVGDSYILSSSSLPVGTIVPATFTWSVSGAVRTIGQDMDNGFDAANSQATVTIVLDTNSGPIVNRTGGGNSSVDFGDPTPTQNTSGNIDINGDGDTVNFNVAVGSRLDLSVTGTCIGGATSFPFAYMDGDAQLSVVWGIDSGNTGAGWVEGDDPMTPAPSGADATPNDAQQYLPPPPPVPSVPEPGTMAVLGLSAVGLLVRRRRVG